VGFAPHAAARALSVNDRETAVCHDRFDLVLAATIADEQLNPVPIQK
jgi:hypothetical protein